MNKKFLLLIFLISIFSLTGCDVKYELEIKNSKITENISFSVPNEYNQTKIDQLVDYYGINTDSSFEQKIIKKEDETSVKFSDKKTKISDYFENSDTFLNRCYNNVSFVLEDGKYYLGTSTGFKCLTYDYMVLDSVTFKIKTYHKVYDNNADEVSNNVYTWNIDKDNLSNQSILFVVSKSEYVWYYRYRYLFGGILAVSALFLITYLVISIFRLSSKKANKI